MHIRAGDAFGAKGKQLIKQRLAVAHRACRTSSHQFQSGLFDFKAFSFGQLPQSNRDIVGRNRAKVESLAAGKYRIGNFIRLCGAEDEFDHRRRFFERFQQRVKRLIGQHMDFVDDVDFILRPHRLDVHIRSQRSNIVDPAIGSTVNL